MNALLDDYRTVTHEASHAVVAVMLGASVVRVIGHRHQASDDERGRVEYLTNDLTPFDEATILLAGRLGSEGLDALLDADTSDERKARDACPLGIERARTRAWTLLQRRDVRNAIRALCEALQASGYVLDGYEVGRIVREHVPL